MRVNIFIIVSHLSVTLDFESSLPQLFVYSAVTHLCVLLPTFMHKKHGHLIMFTCEIFIVVLSGAAPARHGCSRAVGDIAVAVDDATVTVASQW
jgi:hypothetical protein